MMKDILYKIAYSPQVNYCLRNSLLPVSKLLKKPLISISGKLAVQYNADVQFVLTTNQTCSVTQKIFYKGATAYEFSQFFERIIKKTEVFFDIGANIGYFTVLGAKLNPEVKIYAFEPSVGPLHYLKENVALNGLSNRVEVTGKAVAEIDGTLTFHSVVSKKYPWVKHNLSGSHSLQNNFGSAKQNAYEVPVVSLNKFVSDNGIKQLDLIKMDTECTEHQIIESALPVINSLRPIIICEVHDFIKKEMHEVLGKLENYSLFELSNNQLFPMNSILDEMKFDDAFDYVFCPNEKVDFLLSL